MLLWVKLLFKKISSVNFRTAIKKVVVAVFWLSVWMVLASVRDNALLLPSPTETFRRLFELLPRADFWAAAGMTLLRIGGGFSLAVVLGTALAVLCAVSGFIEDLLRPLRNMIKAIPIISVILLVLLWLTTDIVPLFISFLMVLPIIWTNVFIGIRSTDRQLLEMARVFRFGRLKTLRLVYIPSMIPSLTAACTTGLGLAWKAGVTAEVLAHPALSIGNKLYESKLYVETVDLFAWTVVIVILSFLLENLFVRLLRRTERKLRKKEETL